VEAYSYTPVHKHWSRCTSMPRSKRAVLAAVGRVARATVRSRQRRKHRTRHSTSPPLKRRSTRRARAAPAPRQRHLGEMPSPTREMISLRFTVPRYCTLPLYHCRNNQRDALFRVTLAAFSYIARCARGGLGFRGSASTETLEGPHWRRLPHRRDRISPQTRSHLPSTRSHLPSARWHLPASPLPRDRGSRGAAAPTSTLASQCLRKVCEVSKQCLRSV
jgi:hypothetical protein